MILRQTYIKIINILENIKKEIEKNSEEISAAADFGDLTENAEFEAAKEKQALLYNRLRNYEKYLRNEVIQEENIDFNTISFGTKIKLLKLSDDKVYSFCIVDSAEFELDLFPNMVTLSSPLAKKILGKCKGDFLEIEFSSKKDSFFIIDILPISEQKTKYPKLMIIGHIGYDYIYHNKILKHKCIAGSAFYNLVGANFFLDDIALISRIGLNDVDILDFLNTMTISKEGVKKTKNEKSPEFKLYYNDDKSKRDVLFTFGCGNKINFKDIPNKFYEIPFIHISTLPPNIQYELIKEIKNKADKDFTVSIDTVENFIKNDIDTLYKAFILSDVIFINQAEYEILRNLKELNKIIIVKKGDKGAELWKGSKLLIDLLSPKVNCIDSTGSGDILAGAFCALRAIGHSNEVSLERAINLASKSVTKFGASHLINIIQ